MIRNRSSLLGGFLVALALTALPGCGEPASSEAATTSSSSSSAPPPSTRTDPPPSDFVRARCSQCSCAFFSGDDGLCKRPSCKHHWSDHK